MDIKLKKYKWLPYALLTIPATFLNIILVKWFESYTKISVGSFLEITGLGFACIVSLFLIAIAFKRVAVKGFAEAYLIMPMLMVLFIYGLTKLNSYTYWFWQTGISRPGIITLFSVVIFLPVYFVVFSLYRFILLFMQRSWTENSLLVLFIRFLGKGKTLRRQAMIKLIALSGVLTIVLLICGLIFNDFSLTGWEFISLLMLTLWLLIIGYIIVFLRPGSVTGEIEKVTDLITHLADGEYLQSNPISERSPLHESCEKLVNIGDSLEANVRKAIASEKMKVDLITNVSHDLKTPLTSIIGYGEMLLQEKMTDTAKEYVSKLNHKARYLYEIVEDVFELSKASSGNITFQKSVLDIQKLLEQTLGEMDERIQESGFIIKKQYEESPVFIKTDGAHMHRVFQNLFDNTLKYSLSGSRIYLTVKTRETDISITLLNTASYEMDFKPEEITERFARGNKERSGEGSGIGLAIAKAYTEACGGRFLIDIAGDQFKTTILFERILKD